MTDSNLPNNSAPTQSIVSTGGASTQPPTPNQSAPKTSAGGSGDVNPLDALEELLKNAQSKGAGGKGGMPMPGGAPAKPPEPQGPSEEELLAAINLKKQELKQADAQAAQIQIQAMKQEAVSSDSAKARKEQDKAAAKQKKEEQQVADEYAIRQLSHTKV